MIHCHLHLVNDWLRLLSCRHPEDDRGPTAQVLLRQNPYLCPRELTAAIQAHDEELDEWIVSTWICSPYMQASLAHNQAPTDYPADAL